MNIIKIVSGGQTGADRGGLDAAIDCKVPHGGWCPKDRRAEDGRVPGRYKLTETHKIHYLHRTEKNVKDSDATIIFTKGNATGGSLKTISFARKHKKPWRHIDITHEDDYIIDILSRWLSTLSDNVILNIAGSRESKVPGIEKRVAKLVKQMIQTQE